MSDEIEVVDEFKAGNLNFGIGKSYVIILRQNNKIIAMKPVLHWFHAENTKNRLINDANYRKEFLEKYAVKQQARKRS